MSDPTTSTGSGPDTATSTSPADAGTHPFREPPRPPETPSSGRRLRAMAIVRWILLIAVSALAAHSIWTYWGPSSHAHTEARADRYYCPMHPQIRSPDQGECPICHMTLEPIPLDRQQPTGGAEHRHGEVSATPSTHAAGNDAGAPGAAPESAAVAGVVPVTLTLDRQQLIGVTTAPAQRRPIGQALRAPGVVEAPESALAQVHVRAAGYLERVAVRETGVRVARGQTLAWIYSPQIYQAQIELLTAHGWAAGASADPAHVAMQSPESGARAADVEAAARRALELLGLDPADLDSILRTRTPMRAVPLRAPAAGYVTRFAGVLGAYATPEMTLYEIADLSRVWVVASLYERDLPRVRVGMVARFSTPGAAEDATPARVALIEPDVSAATRTTRVRLEASNPRTALRPGQYGEVTFELPASMALVVPRDAVIDTGGQQYVFVDRGGRFEPRPVRVGELVGEQFAVTGGLSEGERVVVRGNFMIDSESRLQASLSAAPVDAGGAR